MCTHIIDFQDRKLKTFKGEKGRTLTQFVEKHPEKNAYFELRNDIMKFTFPPPGSMEGVKSRSKVVLRMNNVSFQYPTKDKPTIMDVSLTGQPSRGHRCKRCRKINSHQGFGRGTEANGRKHLEGTGLANGICGSARIPSLGEAYG